MCSLPCWHGLERAVTRWEAAEEAWWPNHFTKSDSMWSRFCQKKISFSLGQEGQGRHKITTQCHRVTEECFPGDNPYLLIGHQRKSHRLSTWRWYDKSLRRTQEIVAWLAAEAKVVTKWLQVKRDSRLDSLDVCCLPAAWCDTGDLQSGNLCFAERFHHTPSCWKSRSPNRIIGLPHVTYCLPCDMVASNL